MRSLRWLARFWSTDRGLSTLLSLVAIILVLPSLQSRPAVATLVVQILFTLVFVAGLGTVIPRRAARVVGMVVFTAAIALHWLDYFNPHAGLGVWRALGRFLAVGLLTVLVVRQVFREGPITVQRIQGAVAVYLLLSLAWAGIYELIAGVWPRARQRSSRRWLASSSRPS